MALTLYSALGPRDAHLAVLVHRLRRLDDGVEDVLFEPRRDGPPALVDPRSLGRHGEAVAAVAAGAIRLPALWDPERGVSVAVDTRSLVEQLDGVGSVVGPVHRGADDDEALRTVERDVLAPIDAAERAGLRRSVAGSAESLAVQRDHETACAALFEGLYRIEIELGERRYLVGSDEPGLADWWLFCALVRFHPVVYELFKCNRRRLLDYPNLIDYVRDLHGREGVAQTVDVEAIKRHYYWKSEVLNPGRLVPLGGVVALDRPHARALRFAGGSTRRMGVEERRSDRRGRGEWVRGRSGHRDWVTADGESGFRAEPGRYHLYIANNCPWCHRVALTRSIKGLQEAVSMDVLFYRRDPDRGWQFKPDEPGCTPDTVNGTRFIVELYERVGSPEKSLPVLWDRETGTIVNNESAEIIRMLNRAWEPWAENDVDLAPDELVDEIDALNAWIYRDINNGAYKAGFAASQAAYEAAYERFFAALERLDELLSARRFLCGDRLTEADVRLFPTIFRFDPVYFARFRLDRRRVREQAHLQRWHDEMLAWPGVAEASNLEHAKRGYFGRSGNNIVPVGPH